MATSYNTILTCPGARSFSTAGLIARFPMSMVGISTILAVEGLYGSYTAAGLVSAANFVALAIGAPILARCVDRYGQSRVMLPATIVSATSLIALAAGAHAHAVKSSVHCFSRSSAGCNHFSSSSAASTDLGPGRAKRSSSTTSTRPARAARRSR